MGSVPLATVVLTFMRIYMCSCCCVSLIRDMDVSRDQEEKGKANVTDRKSVV